MKRLVTYAAWCALLTLGLHAAPPSPQDSQDPPNESASQAKRVARVTGVPRLIKFGGTLPDNAVARAGTVGIRFAIYGERTGGAPLWQETQNVQLDAQGRYAVLLGANREFSAGIFSNNEARWLGVQVLADAEPEQARVLLVSVPYALKAQDAETLGGRPASAYVSQEALSEVLRGAPESGTKGGGQKAKSLDSGAVSTTGAHTVNAIPKFSATDTLSNSMLMELYNQPAADAFGFALPNEDVLRLGDGTGLPKSLHVDGRVVSKGFDMVTTAANSLHIVNTNTNGLALQANTEGTGFATALFGSARSFNGAGLTAFSLPPTAGGSPAPLDYSVAVYTGNYNQQGVGVHAWSAYDGTPAGDDYPILTGPIGLYAAAAHSTGIAAVLDHRAAGGGQLLSGRNDGTEVITMTTAGNITAAGSVTATSFSGSGAGLTGITAANSTSLGGVAAVNFARLDVVTNQTLTGSLTMPVLALPATFSSTFGVINLGGLRFAHGFGTDNVFVGKNSGNFSMGGQGNTGMGLSALLNNSNGSFNTASGYQALSLNANGDYNTASGFNALQLTTGSFNAAHGAAALSGNTSGTNNTASGSQALQGNTTGSFNTAIGNRAGFTATTANANTTGSSNTFIGSNAGPGTSTQLTNATAIGANALVSASNTLVLGASTVNVGIGTTTPNMKLRIDNSADQGGMYLTQTNLTSSMNALDIYASGVTNQNALIVSSRVQGAEPYIVGLTVKTGGNVGIGTSAPAQKLDVVGNIAASGTITGASFSGSGASLTGVATSAQLSALDARLAVRGINYLAGCDSCNLLQVADSQKDIYMNVVGAMTINQVTCISDLGAPTINLQRDDGSASNILSTDLACSTGGTSTTSFLDSALAVGDKLDFYVTGGTGVAHRVTVVIKATIN
ncbi:MAG: hypothetical protein ABIP12_01340 [Terriglobales bacterium]